MSRRLYVDGLNGRMAIYDVSGVDPDTENEPLTAPLTHIPFLHFHSALEYPAVIQVYTGTLSLSAISANQEHSQVHDVTTSHGQAGVPYVEGRIFINGVWVPLAGHTPVVQQTTTGNSEDSFARWVALGAGTSAIVIHEYALAHMSQAYASSTHDYEVYLYNTLVA